MAGFHEFLVSGGKMSLSEWARLSPEEQQEAAADGRALLVDSLTMLAEFISSPAARLAARAEALGEREQFSEWLMEQQAAAWRAAREASPDAVRK